MNKTVLTLIGITGFGCAGFFTVKGINDASYEPPNVANGKTAYISNCLLCHGEQGRGDGIASHAMPIKPDDIYKELTNPFGFKAELISSVLNGDNGQDGTMPAFNETLTEKEIVDIFGYIVSVNQLKK